jgi:hypothetical protein
MSDGKKEYEDNMEYWEAFKVRAGIVGLQSWSMYSTQAELAEEAYKEYGINGKMLVSYINSIMASRSILADYIAISNKLLEIEKLSNKYNVEGNLTG